VILALDAAAGGATILPFAAHDIAASERFGPREPQSLLLRLFVWRPSFVPNGQHRGGKRRAAEDYVGNCLLLLLAGPDDEVVDPTDLFATDGRGRFGIDRSRDHTSFTAGRLDADRVGVPSDDTT